MKLIFRERDSQKTRQLFEEAESCGEKTIIITPNSRALRVKAENYGFNLTIIEPNELTQELAENANIILHNVDTLISDYFARNFPTSNLMAMSATLDNSSKENT